MKRARKTNSKKSERSMQLIQIGQPSPAPETSTVTIREMFEKMAQREAEMIQNARAAALARLQAQNS